MAQAGTETSTLAPTLRLVVDVGDSPALPWVRDYFDALNDLCAFACEIAAWDAMPKSDPGRRAYEWSRQFHGAVSASRYFGVQRIRLASPLEVVLTAASSKAAPVAYALTAMFLVERAVKLLMEWQRHRKEIEEREPTEHSFLHSLGAGIAATGIVADLTGAEEGREMPDEFDSRRGHNALKTLALVPILYVEMTAPPREPERPSSD
ncbi:hypothetical protein KBX37_10130 [Micromonospora sp. U56]|uniref:hypothetical protein n=1 Tax=Micromonospora sp. U56 TaxID=2824900 RepID=UPI001B371037|nr:hypothetical protein [Micromonospora sp. U56]MBQ0893448.1 hypothetical protein [Micromonospora sp. U56]